MTAAIADTTVVLHLYRRYAPALTWYGSLSQPLGITPITWMEVMYGAGSKAKQATCLALLGQFDLIHLTPSDQDWAMQQMEKYRLQLPLYTHNLKDMTPMIGSLAVKPYA